MESSAQSLVVQPGPDGQPPVTTVTDFGDLHSSTSVSTRWASLDRAACRTFDAAAVYWIYEERRRASRSDRVAADRTPQALKNLPIEPTNVRRGTGVTYGIRHPADSVTNRARLFEVCTGRQGTGVGLIYGYCEFGRSIAFGFDADGGILGRTYSDTRIEQLGHRSTGGRRRLQIVRTAPTSTVTLWASSGFNDGDMQQNNGIGAELVPGATNRLLYAQPTHSEHRDAIDDVSPTGVLWAEAGLQVTERTSVRFAWSAIYVNNILMAARPRSLLSCRTWDS